MPSVSGRRGSRKSAATGISARAVPAMADLPILYSFRRCPYAMRARLALAVSETGCILREVKLAHKPAALIAASPKATVPVLLRRNGEVLEQSLDIMRWALQRNDRRAGSRPIRRRRRR